MPRRQRLSPLGWAPPIDYSPVLAFYRDHAGGLNTEKQVLTFLRRAEALTLAIETEHTLSAYWVEDLLMRAEAERLGLVLPESRPKKKGLTPHQ